MEDCRTMSSRSARLMGEEESAKGSSEEMEKTKTKWKRKEARGQTA